MTATPATAILRDLLARETATMEALADALRAESAALSHRESRQLEEAAMAKTRRLEQLQELEKEREACFRSLGLTGNRQQIRARLEADPRLAALWQRLLELGRQCRELNRLNGITIELGYHHVSQALQLVSGRPAGADSYGPGGRKQGTTFCRHLGQA